MVSHFHLFGPVHMAILIAVVGLAMLLCGLARKSTRSGQWVRYGLGTFLALNELIWYGYRIHGEGFRFPEGLPLQLCDVTLWLTVIALFTLQPLAFETAYFAGLSGSGMALLTPDLWAPLRSYPTVYFFVAHGLVVASILMLVLSRQANPRPGSVWRIFGVLNAYAALVGAFNTIFKTNYMYLCRKPASASLLDVLGAWPFYLMACEGLALFLFWLLWIPVRERTAMPNTNRYPEIAATRRFNRTP